MGGGAHTSMHPDMPYSTLDSVQFYKRCFGVKHETRWVRNELGGDLA